MAAAALKAAHIFWRLVAYLADSPWTTAWAYGFFGVCSCPSCKLPASIFGTLALILLRQLGFTGIGRCTCFVAATIPLFVVANAESVQRVRTSELTVSDVTLLDGADNTAYGTNKNYVREFTELQTLGCAPAVRKLVASVGAHLRCSRH